MTTCHKRFEAMHQVGAGPLADEALHERILPASGSMNS